MTKRLLPCLRVFVSPAVLMIFIVLSSGMNSLLMAQAGDNVARGPKIWLQDNQSIPVTHVGPATAAQSLAAGKGQPLAMTTGDFDEDGVADLLVGYNTPAGFAISVQRGNLDAFAPQSDASFQAIGRGEFPSPFLPNAQVIAIPISPDFLAAGNFTGKGHLDFVAASKGGSTLYLFEGNGSGAFAAPQVINLSGGITTLAAGDLGNSAQFTKLIVGVGSAQGFSVQVYSGTNQGLKSMAGFPLTAAASSINFGEFEAGRSDAAFLSGGQVFILRSATMQLTTVSLPVSATAMALGRFISDRNFSAQIAVVTSDGSVLVAVREEFDPRPFTISELQARRQALRLGNPDPLMPLQSFPANGWKIAESFPVVGTVTSGQSPVFFRTRISNNGTDDIMWVNASPGQMAVIAHPNLPEGAATFLPGQVSIKPYSGSPVQALPMRINVDGRPGVVALHQGQVAPSMLMPLPDPTFFPNRFDDIAPRGTGVTCLNTLAVDGSGDCTLREAIIKANGDTIMLQAGTYSLTRPRVTGDNTGNTGALYVNNSVTIVGAGQNSTFIQAGTTAYNAGIPNGVDLVMAVNQDITSFTNATASLSNLTLQNGHNRGTVGTFDGDGGCMEFDTGGSNAATATATLTLTNVTLRNCDTTDGNGGGLANFNTNNGSGLVTITNSIIQGNKAVQSGGTGTAGGVWVSDPSRMSMTGSQVLNNLAPNTNNTNQAGSGGGITITSNTNNSRQTVIHSSTISGNQAAGEGGGIKTLANLLVDQGSVISNNSAGSANVLNKKDGGGIFMNPSASGCPGACTDSVTLTKVTITGNSAPNGRGGAISSGTVSPAGGNLTMSFSRLAGNTAGVSGSNLENINSAITATNNWWGTDAAGATIHTAAGSTTFDPFIVLTHNATPAIIRINQSTTLTGDLSKDNHGNGAALAGNLNQIVGLPITFDNPVLGSIPQAQPETLGNPVPTATATFNAGGTSGRGSAHATVDQAIVSANSNLIASATEATTTVTITTVGAHNFAAGETVVIAGVGVGGYNGTFAITATPTATTFTYTTTAGLGASSGGTATVGIIILEPLQITKSFSPNPVPVNTPSTLTFSVNNPNVIAVDASFTDTLPAGLVVSATPAVTNTCGGSVTAAGGSGSVAFTNGALPVGACTITVHVQSATDNVYSNTVTINSTAAGTGAQSTSSANLTVINPPSITKIFGVSSIPFGATTSLSFTVTNPNSNPVSVLNGIAFTDTLPSAAPGTLVVATPNGLSNTCSTTPTATAGTGSVSLTGSSLAAGASCAISLNVKATAVGAANNSVTATDTVAGTGNTSTALLTIVKADTTTTVTSSVNPSVFGQSVTLTATVAAVAPGSGTATGTVTFLDGGSPIGTGTLSGGIATFTTSALAVGNHTITTSYGGDGNFNGSTGSLTGNPQVVNKADTTTTVTSSANPSVSGQSVTFTATVAAVAPGSGTATGTVTFLDGGSPIGTGALSGGIATFTTSALAVGNHTITTSYGGDGSFNGSTGSLTGNPQVVNKADTTTAVTSSQNPSVFGQSVTFTATVSPVAPGSGTPVGTVTFLDGGSPVGTGTLSGGVATFTTSALAVGNHTITTSYGGDGNFNGSTGSLTGNPQVVNKADSTTAVTSSQNPSVFGQSVTFTATVSPVAPGLGTPTGTVTFLDGGSPVGTGTLSGGVATFTTSALAGGNHTITTSFGGDGNFNGNTGSLTGNPQVVNKANTATSVTSSVNPSSFGQSVTFTATVSAVAPGTGTATGTVTFLDGGSPIGTGTLSGGIATFTTSALAAGNHTITTSYGGDGNFNGNTGSLTGNPQVVNKTNTTTAVTSSANPSVFGQSVTFTATVSPVAPGAGTATGTVTFLDGGSPIGTGALSGGIATFTTSALAVGNHTVTTSYGGDGNFNGSTGSLAGNPQVVNKTDTTTAVTSSQNPSVIGQSVTFTATVSPVAPGSGTPTGTVTFLDGGSPIGTGTLSGGIATFTTSALAGGSHTITTSFGGDGNFNGSTGSLTGNPQVVNKTDTTTTVTSSQNPSVFGQSVTFTATVAPVPPGSGTPTGTVSFLDGGSPIGTGTLSAGVATFTTSALATGSHTITTSYGGDPNFNGNTGSLTGNPQVVNKANTATSVTSSVNPSSFGQSVTLTATVSPVAPGAGTLTGTVTFLDGGSPIGTGTLSGGIATFTTSALAVGNHTITTSYGGDGNFNGSTGSLTGNPQVVNKANTTTAVTSSANPSVLGQSVTFTATVSPVAPGAGTATGTVTFLDGGSPIGTGTLSGGIATFTTSALAVGNHTVTTSYGGDGNFNGSTGSLAGNPQVVNKANSTTAVTSSLNPSLIGQPVTFTATVSPVAPGAGTPTGTVTFLDGGSPIGTGTLSGGVATFTTSALALGSHTITASYGGDGNFNGNTGSLTGNPQVVNKASTATVVTSSQNSSAVGQSVTFTATVSAVAPGTGTPTGTVTFLDGGNPIGTGTLSGGVAAFTTSALAAGSHTITTSYPGDANFNGNTGSLTGNPQVVVGAPMIAKAFNPTPIAVNGISALTITIANPMANTVAESGVAVTDNLPAGMVIATPNGLNNTCGGIATATAGSSSVSLTGGTIATGSTCTVTVSVRTSSTGNFVNTTGAVSSTNGGTGNTATATLTVQPADLTITKVHNGTFSRGQNGATYTITVNNIGAGPTTGTVTVVDTLPNVANTIVPTALSGTGWACTLGTLTCTRSDVLAPGASYPAITLTVNVPINIKNTFTNTVTVSGGGETNTGNDTGSDTVTLGPPIIITPLNASVTVAAGGTASFNLKVDSPDPTLGVITLSCSGLPSQSACTFNPATIDTALGVSPTMVMMTVTTIATHTASVTLPPAPAPGGGGSQPPLYAALLFPALALAGLGTIGRSKNRKTRVKLALCLAALLMLLAMIGCGVSPQQRTVPGTPAGASSITVTAASPGFTAASSVSLTVQ